MTRQNLLFILLLLVFFLPGKVLAADVLSDYEKQLTKLQRACERIGELQEKMDQARDRERQRRRAERDSRRNSDDDDDDDDDDSDRDAQRRRRKQATEYRKKIQNQIREMTAQLMQDFLIHEKLAQELQNFLKSKGVSRSFNFATYAKTINTVFKKYGIGFDKDDSVVTLRGSDVQDPAYMFSVLTFELACLEAAGIRRDEVPEEYLKFRTYFRFFELLEFYRAESGGFGPCKQTPSRVLELKKRYPQLIQAGKNLHRLLVQNNPDFAQELDLPGMLELLEEHYKKILFWEISSFEETTGAILDSPSSKQKKAAELKLALAKYFTKLAAPAAALRVGEIQGNTNEGFEVKKLRKRKRSKKKDDDAPALDPGVLVFADRETEVPQESADGDEEEEKKPEPAEDAGEKKQYPAPAELRKYRREVEKFRDEHAGTGSLTVMGLRDNDFPTLKQTMTPEMWTYFEKQLKRLVNEGKSRQTAAAEAYLIVLTAEKQNRDRITVPEMDAIREFIRGYGK